MDIIKTQKHLELRTSKQALFELKIWSKLPISFLYDFWKCANQNNTLLVHNIQKKYETYILWT